MTDYIILDHLVREVLKREDLEGKIVPIDLRYRRLKDKKVCGRLTNIDEQRRKVIFVYDEQTFDFDFMASHAEHFLDSEAPEELKVLFYDPVIFRDGEYFQKELDYDTYMKYEQWLRDKDIDRLSIQPFQRLKINMELEKQKTMR